MEPSTQSDMIASLTKMYPDPKQRAAAAAKLGIDLGGTSVPAMPQSQVIGAGPNITSVPMAPPAPSPAAPAAPATAPAASTFGANSLNPDGSPFTFNGEAVAPVGAGGAAGGANAGGLGY